MHTFCSTCICERNVFVESTECTHNYNIINKTVDYQVWSLLIHKLIYPFSCCYWETQTFNYKYTLGSVSSKLQNWRHNIPQYTATYKSTMAECSLGNAHCVLCKFLLLHSLVPLLAWQSQLACGAKSPTRSQKINDGCCGALGYKYEKLIFFVSCPLIPLWGRTHASSSFVMCLCACIINIIYAMCALRVLIWMCALFMYIRTWLWITHECIYMRVHVCSDMCPAYTLGGNVCTSLHVALHAREMTVCCLCTVICM